MSKSITQPVLWKVYDILLTHYGPQHWWPAKSQFEVVIGAILAQATAWTNVEKGIGNLKNARVLSPSAIRYLPNDELASLIHSCGYFNAKALKLKAFADWFDQKYGDDFERMFAEETNSLRIALLEVYGIGEETADCILLYAGNKPSYVVDAYTRRIIDRLGIKPKNGKYIDYQKLFLDNLPEDTRIFNEFHALLTNLGKYICRKNQPSCHVCPLREMCKTSLS